MKRLGKSAFTSITVSVILVAIVAMFGVLEANGNDSDLTYNSLDYDVTVEQNGDLRIRETIDMKLDSRTDDDDNTVPWKQLFQQYTLNPSKLTNITNISVTNLSSGKKYSQIDPQSPSDVPLSTWNSKYANHWYIADVTDDEDDPQPFDTKTDGVASSADDDDAKTVETGWNIPATESRSSLRFQIDMTWEGVTTEYNDVAKFQWEPFGESNPTPIKVMNTTVTLPEGANSKSMWAWLHYAGNSTTSHSGNKLQFTAYNVDAGRYLDMVVMVNANLMKGVKRHNNSDTRQWTIDDETRQEQQWRERQHKQAVQRLVVWISFAVAGLALAIFGIYSAIKSVKASRYTGDITYWRDPPQMSPAAAARLYDVVAPGKKSGTLSNREMAATAMSLVSKGAIAIYPGNADTYRGIDMSRANSASLAQMISMQAEHNRKFSKTSTVVIMPRALADVHTELNLSQSEERLLDIFKEAYKRLNTPVFDFDQMNRAFKKWEKGYKAVERFDSACEQELTQLNATKSVGGAATTCGTLSIILALLGAFVFVSVDNNIALALCISLPTAIAGVFAASYSVHTGLTDTGQPYAGQVLGLAHYLEDFSEFSDRGVLDLTLWDRYLVYATAFGISKKALQQLAEAYPEVNDPGWLDSNASTMGLVYWSTRPSTIAGAGFGNLASGNGGFSAGFGDLGTQISSGFSSIQSTISAAAPSSSGGSGGSFSGGGFGGSGGGSGGGSFGGR